MNKFEEILEFGAFGVQSIFYPARGHGERHNPVAANTLCISNRINTIAKMLIRVESESVLIVCCLSAVDYAKNTCLMRIRVK